MVYFCRDEHSDASITTLKQSSMLKDRLPLTSTPTLLCRVAINFFTEPIKIKTCALKEIVSVIMTDADGSRKDSGK